uniref:C-type lectin domain-containing protein n=1 Tax=Propithecus coquereli TaxID=379532 RepID=A0A2K6FMH3_PROCO
MSEEVTYADLKFQDSSKTENIQELDKFGNKGKILMSDIGIIRFEFLIDLSIFNQRYPNKMIIKGFVKTLFKHKCKPCPKRWMWHEDSCYLLCNDTQPWQESKMACAAQNASLLKINNKSTLDFIKSQRLYDYWLGLSPRKDYVYSYYELDKIFNSSDWEIRNTTDLNERYCGYLRGIYVDYDDCVKGKKMICEKMANPVK